MTWRRAREAAAALLVLVLLAGLAVVTVRAQRESRRQLEHRFELRNVLGASFASTYVASVLRDERRRAETILGTRTVSQRQFQTVVGALGLRAAVLLDGNGRLLRVWPPKPALLGAPIGRSYPHLRRAVAGEEAVSNVVPSAVRRVPIVAFAVPYETAYGRRVFSGGFHVGGTALDAYLANALPFEGAELSLVDGAGRLVIANNHPENASGQRLRALDPGLAEAVATGASGYYRRDGETRFFTRHGIKGTAWELIVSVPQRQLFAPVSGINALVPWLLFAGLALAAVTAAILLSRLEHHRERLATANRQLLQSNEELRDLDRMKDEFVALVSHELRTPLTSIIGYVSALRRGRAGAVPREQLELLDVVDRNARRLVALVSDLLTAAKADAGKLALERELVPLDALVREAVEAARPFAEEKNVSLACTGAALATLDADRTRLLQVLDNLISNAIKFTPPGGEVCVRLRLGDGAATVAVHDTGIGIPAEEHARVFQRFYRASTATNREIQGTGLGLSIVKTIVELHGGTIEFTSGEGTGSTFTITIPVAQTGEMAA